MWVRCTKCGDLKPLWAFNRNKYKKFGISSHCRVCDNESSRKYMANHKEERSIYRKQDYLNNRSKQLKQMRVWVSNNRSKSNIIKAKYKRNNLDKYAALEATRRAIKHAQTPMVNNTDKMKIDLLYKISDDLGSDYHVDHIQPLSKGGIHHHCNLQIIAAKENFVKNNRLDYTVKGLKIFWQDNKLVIENGLGWRGFFPASVLKIEKEDEF